MERERENKHRKQWMRAANRNPEQEEGDEPLHQTVNLPWLLADQESGVYC